MDITYITKPYADPRLIRLFSWNPGQIDRKPGRVELHSNYLAPNPEVPLVTGSTAHGIS